MREVRDFLEVPVAVENVSSYAEFHVSEMSEWEFLNEVVERADCGILLDVNNIAASETHIYPNPTTGILNFDWTQAVDLKMDVYNIYGQGMLHQEINGESHHETDLSYMPEGNYFIVLRDGEGNASTSKILIKK